MLGHCTNGAGIPVSSIAKPQPAAASRDAGILAKPSARNPHPTNTDAFERGCGIDGPGMLGETAGMGPETRRLTMTERTAGEPEHRSLRRGLLFGLASGLAAITCCVSPVVLVLIGVATAAEAVTLGDTLYYEYGWYFRAAGFGVAALAVYLFLRGRGVCNVRGAFQYRRMLLVLVASGAATYAGLFWFTKYLGVWFG